MKRYTKKAAAITAALAVMLSFGAAFPQPQEQPAHAADAVIAFPGAVGGGKYATGGRGGTVVHVTNLNDSGEGSFREAVSQPNRIVVFDVSGTIELKGNILCQSNITVAGQTAPGGSGITLKNYKMGMSGDNIICRYISSRPGPYASTSSGNDAWGGAKGSNSIIDHCSMGWTTDEQWGLYSNNMNYTVQYSVIGPADSWGGHKKGLHGFGMMMGKGELTFDHNLIIHNVSRNFRGKVQGTYTADFTNNIIYDWGYQTAYGTIGHVNYVNNTLKAGKSTTGGYHWMYVDSTTSPQNFKVYCAGNRMLNKDGSTHAITFDNWAGITVKDSIGISKNDLYSASPFAINISGVNASSVQNVESAEAAYDHVISFAGNGISPELRTAIDRQCAAETKNGTGSCSGTSAYDGSVTDLNKYAIQCGVTYEYPAPVLTKTIVDTDNDGMPDEWEIARGLDPNDPNDTSGDYCGQGYTNIEYYINDLTVDSFPAGVVTPSPAAATPSVDAFSTIEAESFDTQSGVQTEERSDGGQHIGFIENGDSASYYNIDFAGKTAQSVTLTAASPEGAVVEIYQRSDLIGKVTIPATGSFTQYEAVQANLEKPVFGKGTIMLKFVGGEGYLLNLDSFVFDTERLPLNGILIRDLRVLDEKNRDNWSLAQGAAVGGRQFGDRDFTFTALPEPLQGAEYIRTAVDSKYSSGDMAVFTAGADLTVCIAFDSRVEKIPVWLSGYTKTEMTVANSDASNVTFDVYTLDAARGEQITLGENGQSAYCVFYSVFVIPRGAQAAGDITADGVCDQNDLLALQKWLLRKETALPDWAAGDLNGDGVLDVRDLTLLRRSLL